MAAGEAPKSLVRIQDWHAVHAAMHKLQRHAAQCVSCCNVWQLVPNRLSLEQIAKLPEQSSGWCIQGFELRVKAFADAAKLAIKEAI